MKAATEGVIKNSCSESCQLTLPVRILENTYEEAYL